jgi:hypothetical protein
LALKILQDQNERIAKKKKGRDRTGDPTQEKGDRTPGSVILKEHCRMMTVHLPQRMDSSGMNRP